MSGNRDKRLRFSVEQDMQLLKEIVRKNPFEDVDRWREVHEIFVNECNVPFSLRTCKDHANHLLNLHVKDSLKMRPKESPDKFSKKKKYLDKILEMRKNYCADAAPRRGRKSSTTNREEEQVYYNPTSIKQEKGFVKREDDSDDDFYWDEENERDKKEKERDANDADRKLRMLQTALDERRASLKERQAKLDEERLELDNLERGRRTEMEEAERHAYENAALQNHTIVTALMDQYNRRTNNLCIL